MIVSVGGATRAGRPTRSPARSLRSTQRHHHGRRRNRTRPSTRRSLPARVDALVMPRNDNQAHHSPPPAAPRRGKSGPPLSPVRVLKRASRDWGSRHPGRVSGCVTVLRAPPASGDSDKRRSRQCRIGWPTSGRRPRACPARPASPPRRSPAQQPQVERRALRRVLRCARWLFTFTRELGARQSAPVRGT